MHGVSSHFEHFFLIRTEFIFSIAFLIWNLYLFLKIHSHFWPERTAWNNLNVPALRFLGMLIGVVVVRSLSSETSVCVPCFQLCQKPTGFLVIIRFWNTVFVCIAFISYFCFLLHVISLNSGPVCTAITTTSSLFCTYCINIFIMLNGSMSGMPNTACPFLGTTKNLHLLSLFLCSNSTAHVPNWVIVVLLYVFNCILSFFCCC